MTPRCHACRICVLLLTVFAGRFCSAQVQTSRQASRPLNHERSAILEIERQLCSTVAAGDVSALSRVLSDDFVLLAASQEVVARGDILPALPGSHQMVCLPDDSDVRVSGDTAWVWSLPEYSVNGTEKQVQILDLLLRRSGQWKIVRRSSAILDPQAYLDHALDLMQRDSFRTSTVDWLAVRREAHEQVASARNSVDTYPAIRSALDRLGDHHSHLQLSNALKRKEAARLSSQSASVNRYAESAPQSDQTPSPFLHRAVPEGRLIRVSGKEFALVVVPICFFPPTTDHVVGYVKYTRKLSQVVGDLAKARPAGWIVDLRGNQGGNMWPMIAGLGPLLEDDHLGEFFNVRDHAVWFYHRGIAGDRVGEAVNAYVTIGPNVTDGVGGSAFGPLVRVNGVPLQFASQPPVAVLIDRGTASSGEATAIAFRGRPLTRFFGEHTYRASTTIEEHMLVDGAIVGIAAGVDADRSGEQYADGVEPDEKVQSAKKAETDADDPVLAAALSWIQRAQR